MPCPHSSSVGPCPQCEVTQAEFEPVEPGAIANTHIPDAPSHAASDVLPPGTTVGRYVITSKLGQGGMGVIYVAHDPQLNREVALKLLRSLKAQGLDDSVGQARLLHEAQAMAQLSHPNVLPVFDVGTHATSVFIAMELVRGLTLDKWVEEHPRPWQQILDVCIQAGRGLQAAHEAGLIHRDFKPTNVLIGEGHRPRVADFGIARSTRAVEQAGAVLTDSGRITPETPRTRAGTMMGSPGYMAPEQYAGVATSEATDQFSFCVTLYEALYGMRPFGGRTLDELRQSTASGVVPPAPRGSAVPLWVHRAIEKGLSSAPPHRHASMAALLLALSKDPARAVKQRLGVSAVAIILVASTVFLFVAEQKRYRACRGAELKLAGVWDDPTRERIERAFLATGKSYAPLAWANVRDGLDGYSRGWVAARTEACEATRVRAEQSDEQMLLRWTCLDLRLDELSALTSAFESADSAVVDQSSQAVSHLSALALCANLKRLEDRRQPPEARAAVALLGRSLARGRALLSAGKFALARELIVPAVSQATTLQLPAQQAEAWAALGALETESLNHIAARVALENAVRFSEAAADDASAARAFASLVSIVGWRLERPDEGRTLAAIATGIIERLGGDPELTAKLAESVGDTEWQAARRDASLQSYREALRLLVRLQGEESADVARLHSSIGWVLTEQGEFTAARNELERSKRIREKLFGADHPSLTNTWNELGTLADSLGDWAEAVRCQERALAAAQQAFGTSSITYERAELNLANMLLKDDRALESLPYLQHAEQFVLDHPDEPQVYRTETTRTRALFEAAIGHHDEAARALHGALTVTELTVGKDHPQAAVLVLDLARALIELKRTEEALGLFDRYLATQEKLHAEGNPEYATALADSARPLLGLGRTSEALQRLERAVALLPIVKGNFRRGARARLALSEALSSFGGDRARAQALAREAAANPEGKEGDPPDAG